MITRQQEEAWFAELAKMGKEQVRARLTHGTISEPFVPITWDWLSKQEVEEERRIAEEADRASIAAERAATAAERQTTAAERANTRATTALVIAIISMIVTIIGIWLPHYWDAHR